MRHFFSLLVLIVLVPFASFSKDSGDGKDKSISCDLTSTKDHLTHSPMISSQAGENIVFKAENLDLNFIVSAKEDMTSSMILVIDKKSGRTLSSVYGGKAI